MHLCITTDAWQRQGWEWGSKNLGAEGEGGGGGLQAEAETGGGKRVCKGQARATPRQSPRRRDPTVTERGGEQQGVIICQCVPITDLCEVPPRTLAWKTERRPANER